jgi:acyl carrier protein
VTTPALRLDEDVLAILKRLSRLPVEPTMESDLVRDLGFDSMQRLELIAELEDHFDVAIPLNATPTIRTAGDVRNYLGELIGRT